MIFKGKTAIVTGSSRGIGRVIALRLAEMGANVTVNYVNNAELAEKVVKDAVSRGGCAIAAQADVSRQSEAEKLFDKTLEEFGQVDILINSAGISVMKAISDFTEQDFDRIFGINVKGTFFTCQQATKHMSKGGKIVNFSTHMVGMMTAGSSVYCASKGAVEQLTRQLAKEFGPKGITVNAVAPGPTETEMLRAVRTPEEFEAMGRATSFGRIGTPEDIAEAAIFFAGNGCGWVSGQVLRVNGGAI